MHMCEFLSTAEALADQTGLIGWAAGFLSMHNPLTSTWSHQNSDVGLEEGEY